MTTELDSRYGSPTQLGGSVHGVTAWADIHPGDEIRLPAYYSSDGWHHETYPQRVDRIARAFACDGPMYVLTTGLGGPQIIHGGRLAAGCIRTYTATIAADRIISAYTDIAAR